MVKVKLELILSEEGITFLNFWDSLRGQDVCCEVKDGKLIEQICVEGQKEMLEKEITLQEFIDKVHEQRKEFHD